MNKYHAIGASLSLQDFALTLCEKFPLNPFPGKHRRKIQTGFSILQGFAALPSPVNKPIYFFLENLPNQASVEKKWGHLSTCEELF